MRESFDDASAESERKTQFYAMLGSRSIWHEGWKAVTTHPCIAGWGNFNDDEWELYHTDVDRSELQQPRRRAAGQGAGARQHLVLGGGRERRLPARRPHSCRDPDATPRPQLTAPRDRYVYYPDTAPVREWQAVNIEEPLVRDRRARRHPGARGRGRALRARDALRRARALRQGQPAPLRQQLRRRRGADDRRLRGHPDRREPDPLGVVREGGAGADVRHRDAVALPR